MGNQSNHYAGQNVQYVEPSGQHHPEVTTNMGQKIGNVVASNSQPLEPDFQPSHNPGPFFPGQINATFQFSIDPSSSPEWLQNVIWTMNLKFPIQV